MYELDAIELKMVFTTSGQKALISVINCNPGCVTDPAWAPGRDKIRQIARELPSSCSLRIYGSHNYKTSPGDLDVVIFGLNCSDAQALVAKILKEFNGQNGNPLTPYDKEGDYVTTTLKSNWGGNDIDWNILPEEVTIHDHAERLDFTVGALYHNVLTGETETPFEQTLKDFTDKKIRLVGLGEAPFRKDPSVIFRMIRLLTEEPVFSLSSEIVEALHGIFVKNRENLFNQPGLIRPNRLYQEIASLLKSGHAVENLQQLDRLNLFESVFDHMNTLASDQDKRLTKYLMMNLDKEQRVHSPALLYCALHWKDIAGRDPDPSSLRQYFIDKYPFTSCIWHKRTGFFDQIEEDIQYIQRLAATWQDKGDQNNVTASVVELQGISPILEHIIGSVETVLPPPEPPPAQDKPVDLPGRKKPARRKKKKPQECDETVVKPCEEQDSRSGDLANNPVKDENYDLPSRLKQAIEELNQYNNQDSIRPSLTSKQEKQLDADCMKAANNVCNIAAAYSCANPAPNGIKLSEPQYRCILGAAEQVHNKTVLDDYQQRFDTRRGITKPVVAAGSSCGFFAERSRATPKARNQPKPAGMPAAAPASTKKSGAEPVPAEFNLQNYLPRIFAASRANLHDEVGRLCQQVIDQLEKLPGHPNYNIGLYMAHLYFGNKIVNTKPLDFDGASAHISAAKTYLLKLMETEGSERQSMKEFMIAVQRAGLAIALNKLVNYTHILSICTTAMAKKKTEEKRRQVAVQICDMAADYEPVDKEDKLSIEQYQVILEAADLTVNRGLYDRYKPRMLEQLKEMKDASVITFSLR